MKKILLSAICALLSAAATAQNVMAVEQKSGTTTDFNVDDIQRVFFKNNGGADVNPSNSVLSSRLKDKDGNPIFLTFVGSQHDYDENNGYGTHFIFGDDGALKSFGKLTNESRSYYTNGLSYFSYSNLPEYLQSQNESELTEVTEVSLSFNDDGYISFFSFEIKLLTFTGETSRMYKGDYSVFYNDKRQLVKIEGILNAEGSDETHGYCHAKVNETQIMTWENDNLININLICNEIEKVGEIDLSNSKSYNISYGSQLNVCRQYTEGLSSKCFTWECNIDWLFMLGLFGIGPVNLPTSIDSKVYTYTLNENGTIASEKRSNSGTPDVYIYK